MQMPEMFSSSCSTCPESMRTRYVITYVVNYVINQVVGKQLPAARSVPAWNCYSLIIFVVCVLVMARYGRGGNDGYDTILHKIQYDTTPKRFTVFNSQQSKNNAAFSLMPSHAFAFVRTPTLSTVVNGIRTLSITFDSIRTCIRNLALIDFSSVQTDPVHRDRRRSHSIERRRRRSMRATTVFSLAFSMTFERRPRCENVLRTLMEKWLDDAVAS